MTDDHAYHTICPYCARRHDRAKAPLAEGARPGEGDRVLCIKCGEFAVVDDTVLGGLRKPTKRELRAVLRDPDAMRVRRAWEDMRRVMRRRS